MDKVLALLTLLPLGAIMFTCICRQSASSKDVLVRVRLGHALMGTGAVSLASGLWFAAFLPWGVLIFATCVMLYMFSGSFRWKKGPPVDVRSRPAPLEHAETQP